MRRWLLLAPLALLTGCAAPTRLPPSVELAWTIGHPGMTKAGTAMPLMPWLEGVGVVLLQPDVRSSGERYPIRAIAVVTLRPVRAHEFEAIVSVSADEMATVDIHEVNGKQTIKGDVYRHLDPGTGSVVLREGETAEVPLKEGFTFALTLRPGTGRDPWAVTRPAR
jgi:hypothetical protein